MKELTAIAGAQALEKANKKFHKFWEENGKPHPSSNAYIRLVKIFFYGSGLEEGMIYSSTESQKNFDYQLKDMFKQLLSLYDYKIRWIAKHGRDDASCAAADAISQAILDLGALCGEGNEPPYKFEAYKRVMTEESVEQYVRDYPRAVKGIKPRNQI